LDPAVTSSFHPPKAAKTSPFSRSGRLKMIKGTAKIRIELVDAGRF
jgi:hypothetical protein